mgnify:CR=1 FL=1
MADNRKNNKIFSEEDFDKPTQRGNWFSEHIKQILLGALVIVCVVLATIFAPRGCTNDKKPVVDTLVTDSIGNDSVPPVVVDSVGNDSIEKPQNIVEDENINIHGTVAEVDKTEENKSVKTDVVNVSDDVVKEALSVIRGNYGNNPDRRRLLKERYQEIQNKVNEMYRNGHVK